MLLRDTFMTIAVEWLRSESFLPLVHRCYLSIVVDSCEQRSSALPSFASNNVVNKCQLLTQLNMHIRSHVNVHVKLISLSHVDSPVILLKIDILNVASTMSSKKRSTAFFKMNYAPHTVHCSEYRTACKAVGCRLLTLKFKKTFLDC